MATIIPSGSKVSIKAPIPTLRKITQVIHTPIRYTPPSPHVSIPAKKLPVVKRIIGGG